MQIYFGGVPSNSQTAVEIEGKSEIQGYSEEEIILLLTTTAFCSLANLSDNLWPRDTDADVANENDAKSQSVVIHAVIL